MSNRKARAPGDLLPLTPLAFSILIALLESDLHGYGIARRIAEQDAGGVTLAPGNLYAAIDRLIAAGLVERVPASAGPPRTKRRRREYRVTAFGREVAGREAERLHQVVRTARRLAILPSGRQTP